MLYNLEKEHMKILRHGFTMIELIFVIVIIGILATVAIPKLTGTASKAKNSTLISFMGTLNRTVAPSMWAVALDKTQGKIGLTGENAFDIKEYTEVPMGIVFDLSKCAQTPRVVATLEAGSVLKFKEVIVCKEGSSISAPRFGFAVNGNETNTSLQNN